MNRLYNKWRYYSLEPAEYAKCMKAEFTHNLNSLRQMNVVTAIMAICFTVYPIFVDNNFIKASFYLVSAIIAVSLVFYLDTKIIQFKHERRSSNLFQYILITIYYINIIAFGIYLGVWANPGKLAVSFMGILICALLLFNLPPAFNLILTVCALIAFNVSTIAVKPVHDWSLDVTNALFAGIIGLFICWKLTVYRLNLTLTASKLEDENTIDELTQLKNRRDFMKTIQRCLSNYRRSDDLLCLGILDIDLFKNYNDHYGHPKGDEALRVISKTLAGLKTGMNIYCARIGGEEFALIWFEEDNANIETAVSQIIQMVRDLKIPHEESSVAPYVTISIGVHVAKCGVFNNVQDLYDLADKALYAAKTGGRDRAVITA